MKKNLLILMVLSSFLIQAQTVLLHENVDTTYQKNIFGVNSKHFIHFYYSFGFIFDPIEESDVTKFGGSCSSVFGLRYKLRITNHMATGVEVEYQYLTISYPTHKTILKDKYHFKNIKYAWYYRQNLGMRGDIMGKFIDVGIWGASCYYSDTYTKEKGPFENSKNKAYYEEDLNYIEPFNYGFLFRLGINQFVLFSEYTYSDLIRKNNQNQFKTVPRWIVGLQIGFHR